MGLPALAVSCVSLQPSYFDTAARVTAEIVARIKARPIARDTILNVNVPDLPYEQLRGWRVTRLGNRHKSEPVVKSVDPRGRVIYWVGPAGEAQDAGPGTDFHAVSEGYVSITPLQVDLTRHEYLGRIQAWLQEPQT